ncbi:hypothetical protein [Cohnella sp. JJ-181]|uniref:hypothetical protein n=1 Tax=Cohnella rhizoplanae TaxID=2974897 RepID=UPI00232D762C|nr:hypothetical protein [Cohnella sp. JJ-181]
MNDWVSKKINLNDSIKQNLKEQWNDYWNSSLAKKAAVLNPDNYYSIGAPHFEKIEYFELREACSRVWDSFINWWYMPAGGQAAMTRWEEKVDIFFKKGT